MTHHSPLCGETTPPLSPASLGHLSGVRRRVLSMAQLRDHGVSPARTSAQCRPGGPWQQLLPGVFVLHPGPPTSEERLHAALLYAGRPPVERAGKIPCQPRKDTAQDGSADRSEYGSTMVTGLAALALYRFSAAPALIAVDPIDVLVPRTRRLRSTGCARIVRAQALPVAQQIEGVPVAPVERALADAVAVLADPEVVRALLTEAVRGGHCEPAVVVGELIRARLLARPQVAQAVDMLLAEGRAIAEGRLYAMVRHHGLPDPLWNVELRLPGGPGLGGVDVYWPEEAVALELDTRPPGGEPQSEEEVLRSAYARKREHLERLGITVVHLTPKKLREAPAQQATVVRTALMAAADRAPAAYVTVLPR
ncbi:hypothetical protein [Streptomyces sp. NBC_01500]|uniref:hypothetical protein n=1 Tax=Streptomyces sp. NBC_01500 TaxID=2903886 RepID=UPI002256E380|nr:hypothetical protein [Streptomyces sp. NBC_01500]MCX4551085.1 hypothetical protein [Streptomyces sp. NBC_01500]